MAKTRPKRERAAKRGSSADSAVHRLRLAARNAFTILSEGRLGAPYSAPFEVAREDPIFRLRHYGAVRGAASAQRKRPPIVLIPPLMVASEVYDIAPELSAVAALGQAGLDVWLVDFGAPEHEEGGMERTLDDHIRAVSAAVDHVAATTGRGVHLAGYSQGGMFAYQTAAYRRSEKLASVITFGSPVDVHKNLPGLSKGLAARVTGAARGALATTLEHIDGLPGFLTSTSFKLLSLRKEMSQRLQLLGKLHDREALARDESKRRFLAGEGFVAWPGPALRKFVDEFVVMNRMLKGGFVIDGRTVTLADITCPILFFVGDRDDIALAPCVRAVAKAAPKAATFEVPLPAGHFGLVVGTSAMKIAWPTVVEWVRWREGLGAKPAMLEGGLAAARETARQLLGKKPRRAGAARVAEAAPSHPEHVYDATTDAIDGLWNALGDVSKTVGDLVDNLRWQAPRLARMSAIEDSSRVSLAKALAEQARAIPDKTFFLWEGRAFTYAQAEERVDNVVRGLVHQGVRFGQRVGVLMDVRPSYLTIVGAVSRLGAASVLLPPSLSGAALAHAIALAGCDVVVTDPEHAAEARVAFKRGDVLVLGGGPGGSKRLPRGVVNLEAIDPARVELPTWYRPNPGRADELALVLFTAGRREGEPRAARITNRRWAASALGAAAAAKLTSQDTVYCCLPPHHAAGMLAALGGAMVGGARLALAPSFDPASFWDDVRRYGASVVFHAGEMLRALLEAPPSPADHQHPLRLFAGSGLRAKPWRDLEKRFAPARVLEFYASTEGNCLLANDEPAKVGAVGKPLPGTSELALVRWDLERGALARNRDGRCLRARRGEVGMLVARLDAGRPGLGFDGYTTDKDTARRIARDVLETGDRWFVTGDLMRKDGDGDYWVADNVADVVITPGGPIYTRAVEDAAEELDGVAFAVAYGIRTATRREQGEELVLAVRARAGVTIQPEPFFRHLSQKLSTSALPHHVLFPAQVPMTEGHRARKPALRQLGLALAPVVAPTWRLTAARDGYRPADPAPAAAKRPTRAAGPARPRRATRPATRKGKPPSRPRS
jgi:putative long chain acyl-CoA synthase